VFTTTSFSRGAYLLLDIVRCLLSHCDSLEDAGGYIQLRVGTLEKFSWKIAHKGITMGGRI